MKTRINLYLNEFRPPREIFTLGRLILLSVAVLCLTLGYGFLQRTVLSHEQSETMRINAENEKLQEQLVAMQIQYASRKKESSLEREVEELRQNYQAKLALVDVISGMKVATDVNYSGTMMDIARASSPAMSIKSININGPILNLSGFVSSGAEVPAFIERFRQLDTLSKIAFSQVIIGHDIQKSDSENKNVNGLLDFELKGFDPNQKVVKDPNFVIPKQEEVKDPNQIVKEENE